MRRQVADWLALRPPGRGRITVVGKHQFGNWREVSDPFINGGHDRRRFVEGDAVARLRVIVSCMLAVVLSMPWLFDRIAVGSSLRCRYMVNLRRIAGVCTLALLLSVLAWALTLLLTGDLLVTIMCFWRPRNG